MNNNQITNRILSISAIITSFATVIALMYQSNIVNEQNQIIQKEQHSSVMPYLTMGFERGENETFGLVIENQGLGPAFIDHVSITYNDSIYKISLIEFYFNILEIENKENIQIKYTDIRANSIIPVGAKIEVLSFSSNQEEALTLLEPFATQEATIQIVYHSIYDRKWKMENMGNLHIPFD